MPCPRVAPRARSCARCAGCSRSTASASGPSSSAPRSRSRTPGSARRWAELGNRQPTTPLQIGTRGSQYGVEGRAGERSALAADVRGIDPEEAVQPDLARPAAAVPGTDADVHPLPAGAALLGGIGVVVARGELEGQERLALLADHEHGTVLALRRVLLVGHPGPHDLARIGEPVAARGVAEPGEDRVAQTQAR